MDLITRGRVPTDIHYTLIGSGRLATHLLHYFRLCDLKFNTWSRKENDDLIEKIEESQYVLLAISDQAIEPFVSQRPYLHKKKLVHFSGSLAIDGLIGLHPLMTFIHELYELEKYERIPFIGEIGQPTFADVFPDLKNPWNQINRDLKPLYHALCVTGGNFSNLLWSEVLSNFRDKLDLNPSLLKPYIEQTFENIVNKPFNSFTGPLSRNDRLTIDSNLRALDSMPLQQIYSDFVKLHSHVLNNEVF